jgi:hypothetical protein
MMVSSFSAQRILEACLYPYPPCFAKRGWKVLIRKDWRWKTRKKSLYFIENIEGLFVESMQEMTALVAGAGKSWLVGRSGEERNSGRKADDGVAAPIMEHFTSSIA